jgi:putative FmdB family regulatory protein
MTYEYVCQACGHQWEAEQSIKDRPLQKCVSCGENKAKRLVSGGTGFLLKGGGWYADLYGSPGAASAKSGDEKGGEDKAAKAGSGAATAGADAKSPAAEAKPSNADKSGSTSTATTASPSPSTSTSASAASSAKAS